MTSMRPLHQRIREQGCPGALGAQALRSRLAGAHLLEEVGREKSRLEHGGRRYGAKFIRKLEELVDDEIFTLDEAA